MGSSIKSHLWLRCGVFHQIPTLAGVLTSSGERYRGNEGLMLCLHVVCCCCRPPSLYICSVVAGRYGNACLFAFCLHVMHLYLCSFRPLSFGFNLCLFLHVHVSYLHFTPSPLCGLSVHTHVHYMHARVPYDPACACDHWRTCDQCSEGWLVDTETWQGSFLLPRL